MLEQILSPSNLNKAYKQVASNTWSVGIDGMDTANLLPWLREYKEEFLHTIIAGKYKPNPVRHVEILKDCGKKPSFST